MPGFDSDAEGGAADVPGLEFPLFSQRANGKRFIRGMQMLELNVEQLVRARGLGPSKVPPGWPLLRKIKAVYDAEILHF